MKIRLSENFYREDESLPVQVVVEKNQALANPITFTITPLNISAADSLLDGTLIEAELPADNPFSPNRAGNISLVLEAGGPRGHRFFGEGAQGGITCCEEMYYEICMQPSSK